MKTTLKAKIIFETDKLQEDYYPVRESPDIPIFTLNKMTNIINSGDIEIELIEDRYVNQGEPVLYIKQK